MAFDRTTVSQNPMRVKLRETLYPYSIPGAKRTLSTMGKFEMVMALIYIANMVVLSLPSGYDSPSSTRTTVLKSFEFIFTILYMIEITLNGVAFGFIDLLHPVRLVDVILVLANFAILTGFFNGFTTWNFSLLPARCSLRILRPFFVTTEFPSVRLFVVSVARSIMQLTDVFLLYLFFLLWFGVAGVFQFGGLLQTRCVNDFHTFGNLAEGPATSFFGVPSTRSWPLTFNASGLNPLTLATTYSSVLDVSVFRQVNLSTNVSELMVVEAMHSFASSFIAFHGLKQSDFVCGSNYITNGSFTSDVEVALAEPTYSLQVKGGHKTLRRPKLPYHEASVSRSISQSTRTIPYHNVTQSISASQTLGPTIHYLHSNKIHSWQLATIFQRVFHMDAMGVCSPQQTCSKNPSQALTGYICPYGLTCLPDVYNPYNGTVNFDNLGMSVLSLFTANTFQLWYELLWWQRDASDALAYPFMILEVVIGSYMIIGLTVVVLSVEYEKGKAQEKQRIEAEIEFRKKLEASGISQEDAAQQAAQFQAEQGGEDPNDPFAIFNLKSNSNQKTAELLRLEKEEQDEDSRARGRSFVNLVKNAAKKMRDGGGDSQENLDAEGNSVTPPALTSPVTPGGEGDITTAAEPTTQTVFSLGVVAKMKAKFARVRFKLAEKKKAELEARRANGELVGDEEMKETKQNSSDSEEELRLMNDMRRSRRNQRDATANGDVSNVSFTAGAVAGAQGGSMLVPSQEQQNVPGGTVAYTPSGKSSIFIPQDSDDSDTEDEQKLRRKAARTILRRKLAKETNKRKAHFRRIRFFTKWYIVGSKWFPFCYVTVIIANTIVVCTEHYGMSQQLSQSINDVNIFFTVFFCLELGLRMLADTASRFFSEFFNIFDLFNAIISILDVFIGTRFALLRALRIFRCFKLIQVNQSLKKWILRIVDACKASPMLLFIILLVMFMFSTFGMQLFGGAFCGLNVMGDYPVDPTTYVNVSSGNSSNASSSNATLVVVSIPSMYNTDSCDQLPRMNFDNFGNAMLTSFIIATTDNWNFPMYSAMQAVNYAAAIPFLVYFYVAVYILMNLLVSILLNATERDEQLSEEMMIEKQREEMKNTANSAEAAVGDDPFAVKTYGEEELKQILDGADDNGENSGSDDESSSVVSSENNGPNEIDDVIISKSGKVTKKSTSGQVVEELSRIWSRSRRSLRFMVEHPVWQAFMICNVLVGTIGMGFEEPKTAYDSKKGRALRTLDLVVNIIFIVEMSLYVHVFGFVRKPSAYLRRDGWNVVDMVLVILSFSSYLAIAYSSEDSTSRTMFFVTFMRALRPMRVIRRARGMRKVLSAVIHSLPEMKNVLIVCFGICLTWAVFGVFFFKGKLRMCFVDGAPLPELDLAQCQSLGGDYYNSDMNFDNVGLAMVTIFVCMTLEDWSAAMFRAMDTTDVGQPFRMNANPMASLYFVLAAAFGGVLIINLFVSVLISSYNEQKRKAAFQRSILLTKEQEAWITTNKRLARLLPLRNQEKMARQHHVLVTREGAIVYHAQVDTLTPESVVEKHHEGEQLKARMVHQLGRIRAKVRDISRSNTFVNLFLAIVLTNFIVTAIVHYPQSASLTSTIQTLQSAFTIAFVIEAAMKVTGEGFSQYMTSQWNRLDFIVAIVSLMSLVLSSFYDARPFSLVQTLRIIRLARLTKEYFSLDRMIAKFGAAFLALGHVMSLIVMVYFIYAVIGMKMFGRLGQPPFGGGTTGGASNAIDTHANFASLGNALLLLARITTGGDWAYILLASSSSYQPPGTCDSQLGNCGLVAPTAEIYYITFMFLATVVLINLFTAVLLDAFSSSGFTRAIRKKEAEIFFEMWKEYDPEETMTIDPYDVLPFIRSIPRECVLGFNGRPKRKRIGLEITFLHSLQLIDLQHRVSFVAMVDQLCRAAYPIPMGPKRSIAYLVYSELLHQPMQQFAQMTRNVKELTHAASKVGKSAMKNVQRLSRLVSGKKVRARGSSRRRRSASQAHVRHDDSDDDDELIHQDVMMFLGTMPAIRIFNPFLLPQAFFHALKILATRARDEKMIHFLHLSEDTRGDHATKGDEALTVVATAQQQGGQGGGDSLPNSPQQSDGGGSPSQRRKRSFFGKRMLHDLLGDPSNASFSSDSLCVPHEPMAFPSDHPVIAFLQPEDISDLFMKAAAMILINAVVKRRRGRLAKRVLESKIEREILHKLEMELGIVVPESLMRSLHHSPAAPSPTSTDATHETKEGATTGHDSDKEGDEPSRSADVSGVASKRRQTVMFLKRGPSRHIDDSDAVGSPVQTVGLGERFTVGFRPSLEGEAKRKVFPPHPQASSDEERQFFIWHVPNPRPNIQKCDELLPNPAELEMLQWYLGNVAACAPQPLSDPSLGDFHGTVLAPYGTGDGMLKEVIGPDPIHSSTLHDEVRVMSLIVRECLSAMNIWQDVLKRLEEAQKPMMDQGLPPIELGEELIHALEGIAYRCVAQTQTFGAFLRSATLLDDGSSSAVERRLATLVSGIVAPRIGRLPQLQTDMLYKQIVVGKERQNDALDQLQEEYKMLATKAASLEEQVIDRVADNAKDKMESVAVQLIGAFTVVLDIFKEAAIEKAFVGAWLPTQSSSAATSGASRRKSTAAASLLGSASPSTKVNESCIPYKYAYCLRTLECIDQIINEWPNVAAVRMIANPKLGQTAATQKAIQYYYSVTDLAEINARKMMVGAPRVQSTPLPLRQAIDKVVVNSLFLTPSETNLDKIVTLLKKELVDEAYKEIDEPSEEQRRQEEEEAKKRKVIPVSALLDKKKSQSPLLSKQTPAAAGTPNASATPGVASIPTPVDDERSFADKLPDSIRGALSFKFNEDVDSYVGSLKNFFTTLSKSEQMRQESKTTGPQSKESQLPGGRALSGAVAAIPTTSGGGTVDRTSVPSAAASRSLTDKQRELITLEDLRRELREEMTKYAAQMIRLLKFSLLLPKKFTSAAAGAHKSTIYWKTQEIRDFSVTCVRSLIVLQQRDALNKRVDDLQNQRTRLSCAERELNILCRIQLLYRPVASSAMAYRPTAELAPDVLAELEAAKSANPRSNIIVQRTSVSKSADRHPVVSSYALCKVPVSVFCLQPNARSKLQVEDVFRLIAIWVELQHSASNRRSSVEPGGAPLVSSDVVELLADFAKHGAEVSKKSLSSIESGTRGGAVNPVLAQLFRNRRAIESIVDELSVATQRLATALHDVHRAFCTFVSSGSEIIVSHETQCLRRQLTAEREHMIGGDISPIESLEEPMSELGAQEETQLAHMPPPLPQQEIDMSQPLTGRKEILREAVVNDPPAPAVDTISVELTNSATTSNGGSPLRCAAGPQQATHVSSVTLRLRDGFFGPSADASKNPSNPNNVASLVGSIARSPGSSSPSASTVNGGKALLGGGTGRTHEQLVADAKLRLEARRRGEQFTRGQSQSSSPLRIELSSPLSPTKNNVVSPDHTSGERMVLELSPSPSNRQKPEERGEGLLVINEIAQQIFSLAKAPRPPVAEFVAVLTALSADSGIALRYYLVASPADRMPRSDMLFYPSLLRMQWDRRASTASEVVQSCSFIVSKKAKRDDIRAKFNVRDISSENIFAGGKELPDRFYTCIDDKGRLDQSLSARLVGVSIATVGNLALVCTTEAASATLVTALRGLAECASI